MQDFLYWVIPDFEARLGLNNADHAQVASHVGLP